MNEEKFPSFKCIMEKKWNYSSYRRMIWNYFYYIACKVDGEKEKEREIIQKIFNEKLLAKNIKNKKLFVIEETTFNFNFLCEIPVNPRSQPFRCVVSLLPSLYAIILMNTLFCEKELSCAWNRMNVQQLLSEYDVVDLIVACVASTFYSLSHLSSDSSLNSSDFYRNLWKRAFIFDVKLR